ncbi:hypothetical protein FVER14953_20232 [Fusarium verticillioides]|nr:hypothetical protein FVER14953_20232 [Fusarium verticillioides]
MKVGAENIERGKVGKIAKLQNGREILGLYTRRKPHADLDTNGESHLG